MLYDPFVGRALEPWSFGIYSGGQSILVGTLAGVSLALEGGAHQSVTTPSAGLKQPGCISYEPAFAIDAEWTLLASLARIGHAGGCSAYLRLSTRPVDQALAAVPADLAGRDRRRRQAVAGTYLLHQSAGKPEVTIAAMGPVIPEALVASCRLAASGIAADVVCVTSPGLLFRPLQARAGHDTADSWMLGAAFPPHRPRRWSQCSNGHPHTLAFLAGLHQVRASHLGVTQFGRSGSLTEVYRYHRPDADSIISAALDVR